MMHPTSLTQKSVAHDDFVRWITQTKGQSDKESLAVLQTVRNVEQMSRTPDEWRSAGLDNADATESSPDETETAVGFLDKAVYCFERVIDNELAKKARVHRAAVTFRLNLHNQSKTEIGWDLME